MCCKSTADIVDGATSCFVKGADPCSGTFSTAVTLTADQKPTAATFACEKVRVVMGLSAVLVLYMCERWMCPVALALPSSLSPCCR